MTSPTRNQGTSVERGGNGERASLWAYRALALLIAIGMWYVTVAEKREEQSEKTVQAEVVYNTPEGMILLAPPTKVSVRLRGNSEDVRRLPQSEVDVQVDLTGRGKGDLTVTLNQDDVFTTRPGLQVASIDPNVLRLQLETEESKTVPVHLRTTGEAAAGAIVTGRDITPGSVEVSGPQSLIESLRHLETAPVDLDGHAITFETQVPIETSDPLIQVISPQRVRVVITLEQPPQQGNATPDSTAGEGEPGETG